MQKSDRILEEDPRRRTRRESRRLSFILYEAFYGPKVFLRATYRQLAVLALMFASGSVVFSYYNGLPPLSALLASVSTITTIGLYVPNNGNFVTLNHGEAILLILMIVVSVGAGASIVQSTVSSVVNGELAKGEVEKRMMDRLKGHTIVVGYGHLGKYVAEKLEELGLDYVVVTRNPELYASLLDKEVFAVKEIEAHSVEALEAAGIARAGTLIVSHTEDPENMMVVLSAKKLRPDIRIISVVNDVNLVDTAKTAGADVVIPASVTVGHLLALSAVTKDLVGVVFSERIGTKEIAQFSVFKTSKLIGKGMQEVAKLAMVIGVVRDDQVIKEIFDPGFTIKEGDTVLVLGDPSSLHELEEEAKAV